ncbi:SAM-dependent methyltransferase [Nocardioides mesophilus]|uniref:SAM-dependent methyltransferase n=1 Tax=Nocardioides mesophilus TaxID=433659 RepID=UPI001FE67A59|nr:SAM-dependent methyltransferase [Nocardioides mesophilus]
MAPLTDWESWHDAYEDPDSLLSERLRVVQQHISEWLDARPGEVTVVSACAGDGRDLLGVLQGRADRRRVRATLLEADPGIARRAAETVHALGPADIEVRCTDAGITTAYAGAVPADLVLLCGIFGNVADEDVQRTVAAAAQLCKTGARVIWTRHRRAPDLTPQIRAWFVEHHFAEEHFVAPQHGTYSVGVQRFLGDPEPLEPDRRLFSFNK